MRINYTSQMIDIIKDLANLGEAIEDMGNECFLCDYQPAHGRRVQVNQGYRPPFAPPRSNTIPDDKYPHEGHKECIIYKAIVLNKKLSSHEDKCCKLYYYDGIGNDVELTCLKKLNHTGECG